MISNERITLGNLKKLITENKLDYNIEKKVFDSEKFDFKNFIFGFIMGIQLPVIYGFRNELGSINIISNSVFIEILIKAFEDETDETQKSLAIEKINKHSLLLCLFELNTDNHKYIDYFRSNAETFNIENIYLKD